MPQCASVLHGEQGIVGKEEVKSQCDYRVGGGAVGVEGYQGSLLIHLVFLHSHL